MSVHKRLAHIHTTNQQMHICKHIQLHIIIFHQHVPVTLVNITSVSNNKNKISIQLIAQKYAIKLNVTLNFYSDFYDSKMSQITRLYSY